MQEDGSVTADALEQAQQAYDAGDFAEAYEVALRGLAERPADVELVRLAGRSAVELDRDGATEHLEKVVALRPEDAEGWRDLAEALMTEGRMAEATAAFREVVRLSPGDASALNDLGHCAYAAGYEEEGMARLAEAAELEPRDASAVLDLAEMRRRSGHTGDALAMAMQVAEAQPDDVAAALDVAELSLMLGRLDEAESAFRRLRAIDDQPGHDVYALHGLIEVEMRREQWRRALDLAVEATRVDRHGRTTDVLAFVVSQAFGSSEQPPPTRAEVDAALEASRAEHRRIHAEEAAFLT